MRKRNSKVSRFRGIEVSRFQGSKVSRKVVAGHISCIYDFSLRNNERNLTAAADKNTKTSPVPTNHNMRGSKVVWLGVMVLVVMMLWLVGCKTQEQVVKDEGVQGVEVSRVQEEKLVEGITLWVKGWNVLVYSNANYKSGIAGMVSRGEKLKVEGKSGKWYKVKAGEMEGWISISGITNRTVKGIEIREVSKSRQEKAKKYVKEAKEIEKQVDKEYGRKRQKGSKKDEAEMVRDARIRVGKVIHWKWKYYYLAYKEDPNNLEAIKGLMNVLEMMDNEWWVADESSEKWRREVVERYKNKYDFQIYLCNRALTLNPPDKEWWLWELGAIYEMNDNIKMAYIMYKSGINEIKKKKDKDSDFYAQLLYNMTFVTVNLNERKLLFEQIRKENPDWYRKNEVDFYYKRTLRKLKK